MQKYKSNLQDASGRAIVGASIRVVDSNGDLAVLFSENGAVPLSNPIATNAQGEFAFYAANGRYSLQIQAPGYTSESDQDVVLLYDPTDSGFVGDFSIGDDITPTPQKVPIPSIESDLGNVDALNVSLQAIADNISHSEQTAADAASAANDAQDAADGLRTDLSDPEQGAGLIGFDFQKNYAASTVGAILKDAATNVRSFPWLAKVDGVTDDGAAIQAAMNAKAAAGGGAVFIPGLAISTTSLLIPSGVTLFSTGRGYNKNPIGGILFKGNGLRNQSIPNATSITVANPDAGAAYLADSGARGNTYSTIDFSTSFSAAVIMSPRSQIKDMGVLPWFDGTDGYRGTDNRMADSWDVGIWARNSSGWRLDNVMSDGQWRKAGLLISSSDLGDGVIPENELGEASFCLFGGARAVSIRTPRNTGVTNYGFAGTDFINCYFRSFDHQSAHLATSSFLAEPQATPSGCLEMDGPQAMRGIQFLNCTLVGRDDVNCFFGYAQEILFSGCYQEARSIRVAGAWMENSLGSRMVATSESQAIFFHSETKYGVDFSPYYVADSSLTGQRYAQPGVFNPASAQDSEWERPNFAASYGTRLRSGQTWRVYNDAFTSIASISPAGALNVSGGGTFGAASAFAGFINLTATTAQIVHQGSGNPVIQRFSSGTVQLGSGGLANLSDNTVAAAGILRHSTDNSWSFGSASFRATSVFAVNGTINTSDAREKSEPLPVDDKVLDAWGNVQIVVFRWLDAIREKGDMDARWHFGVIAQSVRDAFAAYGLDGTAYGLLCHDEWDDIREPVYAVRQVERLAPSIVFNPMTGEESEVMVAVVEDETYDTGETRLVISAGDRWGIRADQCLFLEAAFQRRLCARIEARLAALETRA